MSALEAALVAYAARDGIAYRLPNYRHRRLVDDPIALVAFQLGGEPFAVAAVAYGQSGAAYELAVAGQPLNRDMLFQSLLPIARWFNARFELPWGMRSEVREGTRMVLRAPHAPQVLVTNPGTVKLLKMVGRRLAYLPTEPSPGGPPPAPLELIRFGRHLQFLARRYREPGQQVILDMTTLTADSWITAQTIMERSNLAALDAWVEPPPGTDGFYAASVAERVSAGPIPNPDDERAIQEMMDRLDDARRRSNDTAEAAAHDDISQEYRRLVEPAWRLLWRTRDREAAWPEEPHYTPFRVANDVRVYSDHMAWMDGPADGRRRARDSVRAAIRARRRGENARAVVTTQQACSDPTLMIGHLLDHKAVEGQIVAADFDRKLVKPGNKRASAMPEIRLRTAGPSLVPAGKELWWTEAPDKVRVVVASVAPDPAGPGSILVLDVMEGAKAAQPLQIARTACFSVLTMASFGDYVLLPDADPFTHVPVRVDPTSTHIEPEGDSAVAAQ
jgi:hypothetical protein